MYNNGKQILFGFYNGKFISKGYFDNNLIFNSNVVTITINPTPNYAKVTFSDYGIGIISNDGKSITVKKDTVINYTVSADKYVSKTQSIVVDSTKSINVSLNKIMYTLTIEPTPSDATVTLTASGYNQSGNSITVESGTTVSYNVSYPELQSVSGTYVVNSTEVKHITLKYPSGTVLFESSTPGNYNITPLVPVNCNVICVGGGAGGTSVYGYGIHVISCAAAYAGGGSGGYSNTNVSLNNIQYPITVGAGGNKSVYNFNNDKSYTLNGNSGSQSSLSNLVSAGGGNAGSAYAKVDHYGSFHDNSASSTAGTGGSGVTANGNNGSNDKYVASSHYTGYKAVAGGASVYGGYGAGGNAEINDGTAKAANGTAGYVKIVTL